ncbi:uncharacterized protein EKO05_0006780 [Ascochyta rabiei]|uniref:uncharacterized protein n=1 Tax=Didymella rabiei TaxID=5454 RepID=UPI0022007D92|nr:uncharacterized protein EKO05_0006780 [Ascochyta rabiei]UPX16373.1 hypothetical protein EKO05_0006780 [Ascochyta rabiei]
MAITRSQTAKTRDGLRSRLPQLQKAHERSREEVHPSILRSAKVRKEKLHVRRHRLQRICDSILGPKPTFPGTIIIPDSVVAKLEDATRLQNIENDLKLRQAQVCWVDGSNRNGFLGAGVVWRDSEQLYSASYQLGPNTKGDSTDAEVIAIAAALGRAKKYTQRGHQYQLVRIYSDAREVLKHIRNGTCHAVGPLLVRKTALEGLYARAYWLKAHKVRVELIWVKGHANSEGNQSADAVASNAVSEQIITRNATPSTSCIPKTVNDVPDLWKSLGQDWVDEWLWRANDARTRTSRNLTGDVRWKQVVAWQRSHNMQYPLRSLVFKYKIRTSNTL